MYGVSWQWQFYTRGTSVGGLLTIWSMFPLQAAKFYAGQL